MKTVSIRFSDMDKKTLLYLGYVGENLHRRVLIDCKREFEEMPGAIPALVVTAPNGLKYPVDVTVEGNTVIWDITNSDLIHEGNGEIQLALTKDEEVGKSAVCRTKVDKSIEPDGEAPDPIENWLIRAENLLEEIPEEIADAIEEAKESGMFDGVGISSIGYVKTVGKVNTYRINLTDGSFYDFEVNNGEDGQPGTNGVGIVSITKTGTVGLVDTYTITLTNGQTYPFTVTNGQNGAEIDDTTPALNKVFSSAKVNGELTQLKSAINVLEPSASASDVGKMLKVKTVSGGKVTEYEFGEGGGGGTVIDDTAGAGDTDKAWSADKIVTEIQQIIVSGGVPIDDTAGQGDIDKLWSAGKTATILDYSRTVIPSKNLNVTPYDSSRTHHDVTYTKNEDNSISVTGAMSSGGSYLLPGASQNSTYRWLLPAGTYFLSGGISGTRQASILLYETSSTTTQYASYADLGSGVKFTTDKDLYACVNFIITDNNSTGMTLKLQVEAGESATEYESPWNTTVEESSIFDDIESEIDDLRNDVAEDIHDLQEADTALDGRLDNAEDDIDSAEAEITSINKDRFYNKEKFSRTGNLVQFYPVAGSIVNMRIDFESVDGFDSIQFVHCGENLIDMNAVIKDGKTIISHGITYTKNNGYIHVEGTDNTYTSSVNMYGYLSSGNWWLPRGHYAIGQGLGLAGIDTQETNMILQREFVSEYPWQALQYYAVTRGGNRVNFDYPLMLVAGDESPRYYKAFEGEKVTVTLPSTVYGGWIDINNSVLHITKTVEGGQLVPVTETTVDLDPITISEIVGINTLYSVDGIVRATGTAQLNYAKDYQMPVADFFLDNDYLQTKMDRIRELMYGTAGTGDAFFWITDIHNEVNRLLSFPVIREIGKYCRVPRLFCGGDVADGLYNRMTEVYDLLEHCYKGEIHYTMGNHEWMSKTTGDQLAFWSDMGKKDQIGNTDRHYYYVDNPQQKLRYVVMSSCAEDTGGSWKWGYEQEQQDWLEDEALNVESGWGIILFTHIAYMIDWETGEKLTEPKFTPIETILNSYAGNGEIIAVIAGHAHCDGVFHTSAGIPIIVTTCDKGQAYLSRTTGDADMDSSIRIINTPSEQAFDVVVLDRENKEINMVRIGCKAWNNVDGVIDQTEPFIEERVVSYDRS